MAGEKSEKPTPKRLKDARERGQVARSRELIAALSLLSGTLALAWLGPRLLTSLANRLAAGISRIGDNPLHSMGASDVAAMVVRDTAWLGVVAAPVGFVAAMAAVVANVGQAGWVVASKATRFNWSRLSPASGFAKFAPAQAGVETLKAAIAVTVLGWLGYRIGFQVCVHASELVGMAPTAAGSRAWDAIWQLFWQGGLAMVALAGADYGVQRWRLIKSLKMTRQEVRDEAKSSEGSPEIKSRVRRVQRDMARRRMLKAVKQATVVVTNPTHFAVALEYRRDRMAAPVVVAKGQDYMAQRIRTLAREHGVPIVENVALARALYKTAEVGDAIPAALFGAVAEILAYLVRIKQLML